jgi:hypothetical protein
MPAAKSFFWGTGVTEEGRFPETTLCTQMGWGRGWTGLESPAVQGLGAIW